MTTAMTASRVLVVEDHAPLARLLADGLHGAGFRVDVAVDGAAALARIDGGRHDAIVLDWMLPGCDGLEVLRRLRRAGDPTPVLMLTAKDGVEARVRGLDAGADDYLVKPFALAELVARLRALIRRSRGAASRLVEIADLRIDLEARTVRRGDHEIIVSAREWAVLECLARSRGRIVSREQLLAHAYGIDEEPASNVIDVYIGHLRRKIDRGRAPALIHTRRGLGYILEEGE